MGILLLALLVDPATARSSTADPSKEVLLILGAPGEEQYAEKFSKAADTWAELCAEAQIAFTTIGDVSADTPPKAAINDWIEQRSGVSAFPVWIVYIGHGTTNPLETNLNLRGPDLSLSELKGWLEEMQRPLVFIHGGSASGPFVTELSGDNRIIITATKSADEQNYARFGEAFTRALASFESDLDRDEEVSLLEAFVAASREVETFYLESGRITTEHALLDDNGDGLGHTADAFPSLRLPSTGENALRAEGLLARRTALISGSGDSGLTESQLDERNRLEAELNDLVEQKDEFDEALYYEKLENLLSQLARVYLGEGES